MEKKNVLTFCEFHRILRPYITKTQYALYNELFQWAYSDAGVPEACIVRWCAGQTSVKDIILRSAAKQPENELVRYRALWKELQEGQFFSCHNTLIVSLQNMTRKDVFQQRKHLPQEEYELLAWALVQSLGNDYIKNKIQIAPSFMLAFREADQRCREADIPLNAPYILNILLKAPKSPLRQALNRLRPGLGDQYAGSTAKYAETTAHGGTYEGWEVEESEFLFYALKGTFLDGRDTAEELDIVKGLLLSRSGTVETLLKHAGGREALIGALSSINKTTDLAILL